MAADTGRGLRNWPLVGEYDKAVQLTESLEEELGLVPGPPYIRKRA